MASVVHEMPQERQDESIKLHSKGIKLLLVSSDLSGRQLHKWEKSYRLFSFWTSQLRAATAHVLLTYVLYSARSHATTFFRFALHGKAKEGLPAVK